jgi:hypothetical protein
LPGAFMKCCETHSEAVIQPPVSAVSVRDGMIRSLKRERMVK